MNDELRDLLHRLHRFFGEVEGYRYIEVEGENGAFDIVPIPEELSQILDELGELLGEIE
jgi:hypothetical protein